MLKIAKYAKKSKELKQKVSQAFQNAGLNFSVKENDREPIRIVFAGQYSAGKSSILKMLTGRNDIAIGGGITTQETHTYE